MPKASILLDKTIHEAPAKVKFDCEVEKADRIEWDFGDGNTSSEANPEHRYFKAGEYEVKLTAFKSKGSENNSKKSSFTTTKTITIESPENCLIRLSTNFGDMTIELFDATPQHRDNFIKLAKEGYYNDLLFHRVINGFMIQGGDPDSRGCSPNAMLGSGGPGYKVPAEFDPNLLHYKGALAAARQGDGVNPTRASSGSQFYIAHGRAVNDAMLDQIEARSGKKYTEEQRTKYKELGGIPFLDHEYTVFGRVTEGLDVIDKIAATQTKRGDRPVEDVKMKVTIIE